jgi:hypothetical protein
VRLLDAKQWMLLIDLELAPEGGREVTLGQTAFGLIGVRMAKTIGVHDGGGTIRNFRRWRRRGGLLSQTGTLVRLFGSDHQPAERGNSPLMDHPDESFSPGSISCSG